MTQKPLRVVVAVLSAFSMLAAARVHASINRVPLIEAVKHGDVAAVLSSFIKQPGLPLVTIDARCESGSTIVHASQQRFFSDPLMMSKTSPELWSIPICFGDRCELLREKSQTFKVGGCEPLYFNRNARGYYITQYSPAEVLRLANAPSLKTSEKFALIRANAWRPCRTVAQAMPGRGFSTWESVTTATAPFLIAASI